MTSVESHPFDDDHSDNENELNIDLKNVTIPPDFPLLTAMQRTLLATTSFPESLHRAVNESISKTITTTQNFLDFIVDNVHLLDSELESIREFFSLETKNMESLLVQQHRLKTVQSIAKDIHEDLTTAVPLPPSGGLEHAKDWQTWYDTLGISLVSESKRLDIVPGDIDLNKNADFMYISTACAVLEDPQTPAKRWTLPLDPSLEEDLEESGGRISLTDPLSLQTFKEPMISRQCQHVYEKEHVLAHLSQRHTCPIDGCTAALVVSDLTPDNLMKLRVRVHKAKEGRDRNVESI